jgi:hypothetical protein
VTRKKTSIVDPATGYDAVLADVVALITFHPFRAFAASVMMFATSAGSTRSSEMRYLGRDA